VTEGLRVPAVEPRQARPARECLSSWVPEAWRAGVAGTVMFQAFGLTCSLATLRSGDPALQSPLRRAEKRAPLPAFAADAASAE